MAMKSYISIIFLTIAVGLFSQNAKIDSLQQKLNHAKGHDQILLLNELANEYGYIDINKSLSLSKEALRLAYIHKYTDTQARSYNIIGKAYFILNNYKIADFYYNIALSVGKKYNCSDDIYKTYRLKVMLYANGYVVDSLQTKDIFKRYLNMTVLRKRSDDFFECVKIYALVYHVRSSEISEMTDYLNKLEVSVKNDPEFLSSVYAGEGYVFKQNLAYFISIEKYGSAIKLTNNVTKKIEYLERIGTAYFEVRKYNESIKYYREALQLCSSDKSEKSNAMAYLLKAELGASYLSLKNYRVSLYYQKQALKSPYLIQRDIGSLYLNMGIAYMSIDSINMAEQYLTDALSIFYKIQFQDGLLAALNTKTDLIKRKQQQSQLPKVINKIAQLVNEVSEFDIIFDSYRILSNFYAESGNYKKSNEYLKKWIATNDSINNRDFVNKMSEFQYKYETEKKEQQISLQQNVIYQKDQFILLSVIAGAFLFVALLVIFILYRIRNKAYKQLVYQSLKDTSNLSHVKIEDNTVEIKNANSVLDEELKIQIGLSLKKQIELKVYLEPNLILKTLAERCDTNRSYLSQFINERYNMNFNSFINVLRINEAKHILSDKNNDIPLKKLYLQLGFKTYSVFNDAFKKHVGVTPAFYLKTVKGLFDNPNKNSIQ